MQPVRRDVPPPKAQQVFFMIASNRNPAAPANLPNHSAALGSPADQIAADQNLIGRLSVDVLEYRLERRKIAVDVGEDRDPLRGWVGGAHWTPSRNAIQRARRVQSEG